jgi:hypothetical protein
LFWAAFVPNETHGNKAHAFLAPDLLRYQLQGRACEKLPRTLSDWKYNFIPNIIMNKDWLMTSNETANLKSH